MREADFSERIKTILCERVGGADVQIQIVEGKH